MSKDLLVEYAISLGIEQREGLWKIIYPHPYDAEKKVTVYTVQDVNDERIGSEVNGISVAEPGDKMVELLSWLYNRITKYPYYWPYEATYVDRFGYDFAVDMEEEQNEDGNFRVHSIDITQIAYEIVKKKLNIKPPQETESEIEVEEYLEPGGSFVKFTVTLSKSQPVSEIVLTPFSKYPLEVSSISYEKDIKTFHPRKELILSNKPGPSTKPMVFKFPVITAMRFTIVMRQKNYVKNTYLVDDKDLNKKAMWEKISKRESDMISATATELQSISMKAQSLSGQEIYDSEMEKNKENIRAWTKDFMTYKENMSKRERTSNKNISSGTTDGGVFREDYRDATVKYAQSAEALESDSSNEGEDTGLKLFNKNQRDLTGWNRTWG